MKKPITAVQLGRFAPYHEGHRLVTNQMIEDHGEENTLIMIGSSNRCDARTPFTYPQRRQIIQTLYPEVEIMPLPDVAHGLADFETTAGAWLDQIVAEQSRRNTEFEFYGGSAEDLQYLAKRFRTKNIGRAQLNISATKIRTALATGDATLFDKYVAAENQPLVKQHFGFQMAQIDRGDAGYFPAVHENQRLTKHAAYPERFDVPVEKAYWEQSYPEYAPKYFVAGSVLKNDRRNFSEAQLTENPEIGWAHPEDHCLVEKFPESFHGPLRFDSDGRPLNPMGRTGIAGRGLCGKWGPSLAVDPVITRNCPETGAIQVALIQRLNGMWAFPGGFVDEGEDPMITLGRESNEEMGFPYDMLDAKIVYQGIIDSSRNTDHAWIESVAGHKHLTGEEAKFEPKPHPTEVTAARWFSVDEIRQMNFAKTHLQILEYIFSQQS